MKRTRKVPTPKTKMTLSPIDEKEVQLAIVQLARPNHGCRDMHYGGSIPRRIYNLAMVRLDEIEQQHMTKPMDACEPAPAKRK